MKTGHKKKYIGLFILSALLCVSAAGFLIWSGSIPGNIPPAPEKDTSDTIPAAPPEANSIQDEMPSVSDSSASALPQDQSASPPLLNPPSGICDPAVTELQRHGELQILTGGPVNVVYYCQGDERWSELYYGSDRISTHGCGPTAMAMVVSSLTGTLIDPPSMAQWAAAKGYWALHSGSYHSIVIGTAEAFGLHAESFASRDADKLREALFSGKLLVALMGPGHFTQGGHFIILRGVTLSGDILVADPGSEERSLTSWDAQLILDELSSSTVDGSPLWLISVPDGTGLE